MKRINHIDGMLFGSLAADALSLGSHWVYNTTAIEKRLGRPDKLVDPIVKSFHPNRKKGEFTHYGDQALFLLEWIAEHTGYESDQYFSDWKRFMTSYDGYMDHATKDTLSSGKASSMDDIAGASRTAVLALLYPDDPQKLADTSVEHALLTHNDPLVADTARFFSLLLFEGDVPMKQAMKHLLSLGGWKTEILGEQVEKGLETTGADTTETITELGQMCTAKRALSAVVHLLTTYEDDYREAMIANTAAGGDSAARGLLSGMILGSRLGIDAVDSDWIDQMVYKDRIGKALKALS
jgi:ADP-ribosylglycohydrolase